MPHERAVCRGRRVDWAGGAEARGLVWVASGSEWRCGGGRYKRPVGIRFVLVVLLLLVSLIPFPQIFLSCRFTRIPIPLHASQARPAPVRDRRGRPRRGGRLHTPLAQVGLGVLPHMPGVRLNVGVLGRGRHAHTRTRRRRGRCRPVVIRAVRGSGATERALGRRARELIVLCLGGESVHCGLYESAGLAQVGQEGDWHCRAWMCD